MSDQEIDIDAIQRRDRTAWASLYDSTVWATFALIWNLIGGDSTACEDLNQETWLAAIDSIDDFDPQRGSLKSWVLGIARKLAMTHLRRAYRDRAVAYESDEAIASPALVAVGDSPTASLETNERAAILQAALATLSTDRRDVLQRKYVDGQSVKQIAETIGKTPKAVESLLTRAREQLREVLNWTLNEMRTS